MRYLFGNGINEIINENGNGFILYSPGSEKFFYNIGQPYQDIPFHHKDDLSYSPDIFLEKGFFNPFYAKYKIKNSNFTMFQFNATLFIIAEINDILYIKTNSEKFTITGENYIIGNDFFLNIKPEGILSKGKHIIKISDNPKFDEFNNDSLITIEKEINNKLGKYGHLALNPIFFNFTYSEHLENKFYIPVSKSWVKMLADALNDGNGILGPVIFAWDSTFASIILLEFDIDLSYKTFKSILEAQQPDGRIPQFRIENRVSNRTNPPVWFIYLEKLFTKSVKYTIELYDKLFENYLWFKKNRMNDDFTFSWGTDNEDKTGMMLLKGDIGAIMETGLDDSPIFAEEMSLLPGGKYNAACIDLTSLVYHGAEVLYDIGKKIKVDSKMLTILEKDLLIYSEKIHNFFRYNYPNSYIGTNPVNQITPLSFYPMLTDMLTGKEADMLESLYNSEHFEGDHKLFSLSKKSTFFDPDGDYWKGRIWPPMNYLVFLGLNKYNRKLAYNLMDSSLKMCIKEWERDNHIHENYSGVTGYGEPEGKKFARSGPFYNWGGLMALMYYEYYN